jgi:serine/threonine protein kinase
MQRLKSYDAADFEARYDMSRGRLVGQGTYGKVYKTYDKKRRKFVAIKFVTPTTHDYTDAGYREVIILAALRPCKRYLPCLLDAFEIGNEVAIVSDYVDGTNLHQLFAMYRNMQQALPLTKSFKIARDLLTALQSIHAADIVHNDIKAANIVYSSHADRPVVLDFGLGCVTAANFDDVAQNFQLPREFSAEGGEEARAWSRDASPSGSPGRDSSNDSVSAAQKEAERHRLLVDLYEIGIQCNQNTLREATYVAPDRREASYSRFSLDTDELYLFLRSSDVYCMGIVFAEMFTVPREFDSRFTLDDYGGKETMLPDWYTPEMFLPPSAGAGAGAGAADVGLGLLLMVREMLAPNSYRRLTAAQALAQLTSIEAALAPPAPAPAAPAVPAVPAAKRKR